MAGKRWERRNRRKAPRTVSVSEVGGAAGGARAPELCGQLMESRRGVPGQSHSACYGLKSAP